MKPPLIILTGPTAVGKTSASIRLAKAVGGEIISADSMQVYRYMDIGSAKISPEEMEGVPHHLIDVLLPNEEFHVVKFQQMAKEALEGIYRRGHIPIVAGGTGFYIQALLYDIDFSLGRENPGLRKELEHFARENGNPALHQKLMEIDPEAARQIHANNRKRVIRAIEFYCQTGSKISEHNAREHERTSPYNFLYFVLNDERNRLYARINSRVDEMMEKGLLGEVKRLKEMGYGRSLVSMQGLGYKELLAYLDGEYTLEEAVCAIKQHTRHFAKRQITWFKRERDVIWTEKQEYAYDEAAIVESMLCLVKRMEEKGKE